MRNIDIYIMTLLVTFILALISIGVEGENIWTVNPQTSTSELNRELDIEGKDGRRLEAVIATPSYRIDWCETAVTSRFQLWRKGVCCYHNVVLAKVKGIHCACCKLYNVHCNWWLRPHCKYIY